jgi:hypothetical protein
VLLLYSSQCVLRLALGSSSRVSSSEASPSSSKSTQLSDVVGPQLTTTVDIGAKIIPSLFLGGYLGLNVGNAGGKLGDACAAAHRSCTSKTHRIGIQAQFHFMPDGKVKRPWAPAVSRVAPSETSACTSG